MNKLVFVVEDNLAQQKMLQVHLEEMLGNYQVKTFVKPEDMMSHLNEKPFAIVLDHFFAPGSKNGLDYLNELKRNHSSIPVIYHTTSDDAAVRAEAEKLGVVQFILKDSASLVRLRTVLDDLEAGKYKKGFFKKLFGG